MRDPSPSQFADVAAVLDAAIAAGGATYKLPSKGKAIRWRQRAYSLRTLLLKQDAARKAPGIAPTSPYDSMFLRLLESDPSVVIIETRQPEGVLTDSFGNIVTPKQRVDLVNDPLQQEADELVRNLSL